MNQMVRYTLIAILQQSCIIDTEDPKEIEMAMKEQRRIIARIEKTTKDCF